MTDGGRWGWGAGARLRRYYALLLCRAGGARLVKALDGDTVLAESDFSWQLRGTYELSLQVVGHGLRAWIDGALLFDKRDSDRPLDSGAIALVCEEGRMAAGPDRVQPAV